MKRKEKLQSGLHRTPQIKLNSMKPQNCAQHTTAQEIVSIGGVEPCGRQCRN